MVVWWLQNHQTTVPSHVFSSDGVVSRVFSPFLTTEANLRFQRVGYESESVTVRRPVLVPFPVL